MIQKKSYKQIIDTTKTDRTYWFNDNTLISKKEDKQNEKDIKK